MSSKEDLAKKLENYQMSPEAKGLVNSAQILLLVGVAGAGKNTIIGKLLETGKFRFMVSHTTREPRSNFGVMEQNGREFHFISWDEAEKKVDAGEFIEAKIIHRKNMYGTSIEELTKAKDENKVATTDIDIQGVEEYKNISSNVTAVFVLPPDFTTWQKRLLARYKDQDGHEQEIYERLQTAEEEFDRALKDGYFHFVVNDDLESTVQDIENITFGGQTQDEEKTTKLAEQLLEQTQDYLKNKK